jgi:hypothetical protein
LSILTFAAQDYYCVGALTLVEIITMIFAIKNFRRHRELRVFTLYILLSLTQMWTPFWFGYSDSRLMTNKVFGGVTNSFMLFEFTVVVLFVIRHLTSRARRTVVVIDATIYCLFILWAFLKHPETIFKPVFFFFESFFLLLPCLLYIYDLFVKPPAGKLRDYPSFWVMTGFLVLNGCSIPLMLVGELLRSMADYLYTFNFILYMALFALLIRAYLCAPVKRAVNGPA